MMTLRELRDMVKKADVSGKRVPSARSLMESGCRIVARKEVNDKTGIWVFENGYVLYYTERNATVFPLHESGAYCYRSVTESFNITADYFENENWYVRLLLEGEDRIMRNQDKREAYWNISYSAIAEDWGPLGTVSSVLEDMVRAEEEAENLERLLSALTENQRNIVIRLYLEKTPQMEIANELGISQQAISDTVRKAKRRLMKKFQG